MSRLAHTYDTHHNRFLQSGNAQLTGGGIKKNKERPLKKLKWLSNFRLSYSKNKFLKN